MATYGLRQLKLDSNLHFKLSLKILKQLLTMITHTVNSVLSILRLSQFLCHSRTGVQSFFGTFTVQFRHCTLLSLRWIILEEWHSFMSILRKCSMKWGMKCGMNWGMCDFAFSILQLCCMLPTERCP